MDFFTLKYIHRRKNISILHIHMSIADKECEHYEFLKSLFSVTVSESNGVLTTSGSLGVMLALQGVGLALALVGMAGGALGASYAAWLR